MTSRTPVVQRGRFDFEEPVSPAADPEAIVAAARRRQHRRRVRLTAISMAALVTAAGVWFVIGSPGNGLSLKEVEARDLAALHSNASAGQILFERRQFNLRNLGHLPAGIDVSRCLGCGLTRTWINLATGGRRDLYYGSGGRLVGQNTDALLRNDQLSTGQVDYRTRTWHQRTIRLRAQTLRIFRDTLSPLNDTNLLGSPGWRFRLIGRQTLAGQPTLHLHGTYARPSTAAGPRPATLKPAASSQANGTYFVVTAARGAGRPTFDLWLNARTYLPVREQVRGPSGLIQTTTAYKWLPRTRLNLAKLKLNVPAGFADSPSR